MMELDYWSILTTVAAVGFVFFLADLGYTIDHYLVHHDRRRYACTHGRHHRRYNGRKRNVHLDRYEVSTYSTAAFMLFCGASVVSLFTGNPGFVIGAVLKWLHSLGFHLYQHCWWNRQTPVAKLRLPRPRRHWGLASAKYHAFHHSDPDDPVFTYAESWAGFDRILEWLDPWLVRLTADGRPTPSRARRTARLNGSAEEVGR